MLVSHGSTIVRDVFRDDFVEVSDIPHSLLNCDCLPKIVNPLHQFIFGPWLNFSPQKLRATDSQWDAIYLYVSVIITDSTNTASFSVSLSLSLSFSLRKNTIGTNQKNEKKKTE